MRSKTTIPILKEYNTLKKQGRVYKVLADQVNNESKEYEIEVLMVHTKTGEWAFVEQGKERQGDWIEAYFATEEMANEIREQEADKHPAGRKNIYHYNVHADNETLTTELIIVGYRDVKWYGYHKTFGTLMRVKPCKSNDYDKEDYMFENSWMMFSTKNPYTKGTREVALFDNESDASTAVCNLIEGICDWINAEGRWRKYEEE